MIIEQFYDKGLAHGSYAIIDSGEMAIIDPARDPKPYYDFAKQHNAKIVAVIETHPHADFVSSHKEIADANNATIYVSKLLGAEYNHKGFDHGDTIKLGNITLHALNTPGHSPDSISILLKDEKGNDHAVFTGDTLFVGDVGRPDLRENVGNLTAKREELARQMYQSTRNVLMALKEEVIVYPAHGAGSLCGKNLSSDLFSTIGREISSNYALQQMNEDKFVDVLLEDQPFIPKYFGYNVNVNKKGAESFEESIQKVARPEGEFSLKEGILIIDTRPESEFKKAHIKGSINIQDGGKFETWLGSIVGPEEKFYLVAANKEILETVIRKAAKIGYETNIEAAFVANEKQFNSSDNAKLDLDTFKQQPEKYTILDVRNNGEVKQRKIFKDAIAIPLPELRERVSEIPTGKPIVVHCAAGYRSAAAVSIIESQKPGLEIYDLSEAIKEF